MWGGRRRPVAESDAGAGRAATSIVRGMARVLAAVYIQELDSHRTLPGLTGYVLTLLRARKGAPLLHKRRAFWLQAAVFVRRARARAMAAKQRAPAVDIGSGGQNGGERDLVAAQFREAQGACKCPDPDIRLKRVGAGMAVF